jgi:hypothetical protein
VKRRCPRMAGHQVVPACVGKWINNVQWFRYSYRGILGIGCRMDESRRVPFRVYKFPHAGTPVFHLSN